MNRPFVSYASRLLEEAPEAKVLRCAHTGDVLVANRATRIWWPTLEGLVSALDAADMHRLEEGAALEVATERGGAPVEFTACRVSPGEAEDADAWILTAGSPDRLALPALLRLERLKQLADLGEVRGTGTDAPRGFSRLAAALSQPRTGTHPDGSIDLRQVALDVYAGLRPIAQGVEFALEAGSEPIWVQVDPAAAQQLVFSLLLDAVARARQSSDSHRLIFRLQQDGPFVDLCVIDDGDELTDQELAELFEACGRGVGESASASGSFELVRSLALELGATISVGGTSEDGMANELRVCFERAQ